MHCHSGGVACGYMSIGFILTIGQSTGCVVATNIVLSVNGNNNVARASGKSILAPAIIATYRKRTTCFLVDQDITI